MAGPRSNDKLFAFVATVLAIRTPMTIPDIARRTESSRATAYRRIQQMQAHFPIEYQPGGGPNPGRVIVRKPHHG
jgi:hypothetical protein